MRINNNAAATTVGNLLSQREVAMGKSLEKLASGYRINRAADDAAGLVISQKLRATVSGLQVATRNVQDAISMVQVMDGAYSTIADAFQRRRDLAIQFLNSGSVDQSDPQWTDSAGEWRMLDQVIAGAALGAQFAGTDLINGHFRLDVQVGANHGDTITIDMRVDPGAPNHDASLAASAGVAASVTDSDVLTKIDNAIAGISSLRGYIGATQNRLEATMRSLQAATENLAASESRIRDTDMAQEMVSFTRHQILMQAGTAMLAQANTLPQAALRLLQ